jgi:hypothetical protein
MGSTQADQLKPESAGPAYIALFWRPFLGNVAYSLWDILRALDVDGDGQVDMPITIDEPALLMGIGDRYTILGRRKTKSRPAQIGALQRLDEAGLVHFKAKGPDKFHLKYTFSVAHRPAMLNEGQLESLKKGVRDVHTRFVGSSKLEKSPYYYTKPWLSHSTQEAARIL